MALDHPLTRFIPWCPHCAGTESKRRRAVIQSPELYDDEVSRVLLDLLLKDGWSLMSSRPYWEVGTEDYKNLQQFANTIGLPIAVSPEGFPIVLRRSTATVDFAAFVNYEASLTRSTFLAPASAQQRRRSTQYDDVVELGAMTFGAPSFDTGAAASHD